jgi:hypothetical protein
MVSASREKFACTPSSSLVYQLYGLSLSSQWPLPYPRSTAPGLAIVELRQAPVTLFSRVSAKIGPADQAAWCHHQVLDDGSVYLRWSGLFEFLVAHDGKRVSIHCLHGVSREAFHSYLLGPALSFALLKLGIEPLHATTVVADGFAVSFMGDCGSGKSSLAAAFLKEGYPVLTDDLQVLSQTPDGLMAHPGPPRIKLFPEIGAALLRTLVRGVPMGPLTSKLIVPLDQHQAWTEAVPLRAIYVLTPPATGAQRRKVTIRRLSARQALLVLLRNTFNRVLIDSDRLERQFSWAARLASTVPIKLLSYPRALSALPAVRRAILDDLAR